MVNDPQLSRLRMSLRQVELNRNASAEKRARFRQSSFSRQRKAKPATITECPQNVIELRKLINTWTAIDKDQKKSLSKMNNAQFNLKLEYNEFLTGRNSDSGVNLLLPPGFRFHANGEPKQRKSLAKLSQLNNSVQKTRESRASIDSVEKVRRANGFDSKESPKKAIDEEIKETEMALEEIKNDRQLHAISRKISQMKESIKYIRAHSASDLATRRELKSTQRREYNDTLRRKISTGGSTAKSTTKSQNDAGPGFLRGTVSSENKSKRSNSSSRKLNLQNNHICSSTDGSIYSPLNYNCKGNINGLRKGRTGSEILARGPMALPNKGKELERFPSTPNQQSSQKRKQSRTEEFVSPQISKTDRNVKTEKKSEELTNKKLIKRPVMEVTRKKPAWETEVQPCSSSSSRGLNELENGSNESVLKVSTEECYRRMMRKASISDEQKLAKLSEMMEGVAVGGKKRKSSTMCHINATQKIAHQSSCQLVPRDKPARSLEALKSMVELEAKSSRSKVQDFLHRLPTPDVTIRRWRTSKGDMQVIERRCKEPNEEDKTHEDECKKKKKSRVKKHEEEEANEGDEIDSDHASVSTNLSMDESEDSEKLAINTALTSWPTHWAQRAAFLTQCTPDSEREEGEIDPEKEFKKLLRCRYLRIPSQMLKRNSSMMSTTSTQAWK